MVLVGRFRGRPCRRSVSTVRTDIYNFSSTATGDGLFFSRVVFSGHALYELSMKPLVPASVESVPVVAPWLCLFVCGKT